MVAQLVSDYSELATNMTRDDASSMTGVLVGVTADATQLTDKCLVSGGC